MKSPYKVLNNWIQGAGVRGHKEGQSFLVFPHLCCGILSCSSFSLARYTPPLPPAPAVCPGSLTEHLLCGRLCLCCPPCCLFLLLAAEHVNHDGAHLFFRRENRVRNTSGFHWLFQQNQAFSLDCLTPGLGRLTAWILNAILSLHQKPPETVLDDMGKVPEYILPEKALHLYVSDQLTQLFSCFLGRFGRWSRTWLLSVLILQNCPKLQTTLKG